MPRPWSNAEAFSPRILALRSLLTGLVTLTPCALAAQESSSSAALRAETLHLEVIVNGRPKNLIAKFRRDAGGRFASPRSELTAVGVRAPGSGAPEEEIALDAIDGLAWDYDAPGQRMRLTLAPQAMGEQVYGAVPETRNNEAFEAGVGGVLNYHLRTGVMRDFRNGGFDYQGASGTFDARLFSRYGTLKASAIVGSTVVSRFTQTRLETNYTYADAERMINYVAGDTMSSGPAWARPVRLGGAQVQRNFGLRPDIVTAALPSITGSAAAPTTVDVYVNNTLTVSQPVDAGYYRIDAVPISGNGTTRVLARDATGRVIETSTPFIVSSKILKPGLWDWSFEAGLPRQYYAIQSDNYSKTAVASASLRGGLLDWLTLEAHGETTSSQLANASAGVNVRVLDRAVATFAAGGSAWRGQAGGLFYAGLETRLFDVSVSFSTQRTFGIFNDIASVTAPTYNPYGQPYQFAQAYGPGLYGPTPFVGAWLAQIRPPRALDRLSIGFRAPFDEKTSLNLMLANIEQGPGALSSRMISLGASRSFFGDVNAYLALTWDFANPAQRSVFAGLSVPFGKTTVSTSFAPSRGLGGVMVDAGRPIDQEPGSWGWRFRNTGVSPYESYREASMGYRHEYGRVEAGVSQMSRTAGGYADAEGALAAVWGGGVGLSNRIDDSFALVNAGAPGVQVLAENRPAGRTGPLGTLVVPGLRAFEQNRVALDVTTLPPDRTVSMSEHVVRPARGAGVAIDFAGKRRQQGVIVVLKDGKGAYLPAGAHVSLAGSGETLVVGYDGRLWIPNPQPEDEIVATLGMSQCRARLSRAAESGRIAGPIVCE